MTIKHSTIRFPLWQFLNQPLFCSTTILNPRRYWHRHKVDLLERCWIKQYTKEDRRHS
ncbi:hypothetical protein [Microseira sp. BLCC-F43]|uniref:hypothetical protein n=1 Tax=Microseira sp. BLCC-F43 TaxID=3153602 RepID=UPI0035BB7DCA